MNAVPHYRGQVVDHVDLSKRRAVKPAVEDMFWHLVQISDNIPSSDIEFLRFHGIEFYQPMIRNFKPVPARTLSRQQRRTGIRPLRERVESMFPGYAFVDFSRAGEHWREMFAIARIRGLAIAGGQPLRVEWKVIASIKAQAGQDGIVPGTVHLSDFRFELGETVRVGEGPFAGFNATVIGLPDLDVDETGSPRLEQLDDSMRVQLLVSLFGRENTVELMVGDIDKL